MSELKQFDSTAHVHHYTLFPDRLELDGKLIINDLSYLLFFFSLEALLDSESFDSVNHAKKKTLKNT